MVGGRARVEGVGELVTPLPFEPRDYLLVLPPFGVDTARVYRAWDEGHREGDEAAERADGGGAGGRAPAGPVARRPGRPGRAAPTLAGSGSTWFVEACPTGRGRCPVPQLGVGAETARLVRAHAVPAGWEGD